MQSAEMNEKAALQQAAKQLSYKKRMVRKLLLEKEKQKKQQEQIAAQEALDTHFMREALKQAKKAAALLEVPIGAVLVKDGKIIARGYNRRNTDHSALSHAEVTVIKKGSRRLNDWRLTDCTLYVTLEPCPMCAGALVQARIGRVVAACKNEKAGCAGSVLDLFHVKGLNHQVDYTDGILSGECRTLLQDFFLTLRKKNTSPD